MGYKAIRHINNKNKPTQKNRRFIQSPSTSIKSLPPSSSQRSCAIKKSFSPSTRCIVQSEIFILTIICCLVTDRVAVDCTMLDSRIHMNNNFGMSEWIEDDVIVDSDNQFVERVDDNIDMERLQRIIMQGLNLTRIPDVSKVSQWVFLLKFRNIFALIN